MEKKHDSPPLHLSSSFSSLISQTTLIESKETSEKSDHPPPPPPPPSDQVYPQSFLNTATSTSYFPLEEAASPTSPLSIDLSSLWHIQARSPPQPCLSTSGTTLHRKKTKGSTVSYFDTNSECTSPSTMSSRHHYQHQYQHQHRRVRSQRHPIAPRPQRYPSARSNSHYNIIPIPPDALYHQLNRHNSSSTNRSQCNRRLYDTNIYMGDQTISTSLEPQSPVSSEQQVTSMLEMKKRIICVLGQSLINGGCPVYRVDDVLQHCTKLIKLNASFTFLPDSIMVTFIIQQEAHSMMVKARPSFDTGKLGRINAVMNQFLVRYQQHQQQKYAQRHGCELDDTASLNATPLSSLPPLRSDTNLMMLNSNNGDSNNSHDNVDGDDDDDDNDDDNDEICWNHFDQCLQSLYAIMDDDPTCGVWWTLIGYSASAFSANILLFNGSWIDASLSGVCGAIVALLSVLSSCYPIYGRVFELSSSVVVAILARALHRFCCFSSVGVSAILILLPGYTMCISVMELSARHINTGTIKLVYAVVYAFVLAYGLQLGSSMYSVIDPTSSDVGVCEQNPVSTWLYIPLFPVMSISIGMSFGSHSQQWLTQTICAAVGYLPSYFLGKVIPDGQIVGSIAAFAVGLYANLALKITGEAPLVPLCVGVTLLVPGSIGVRGAYSLLHQEGTSHDSFPIQMLTICLGIVAGLFAAAMIVYPSGKRRSLYVSL